MKILKIFILIIVVFSFFSIPTTIAQNSEVDNIINGLNETANNAKIDTETSIYSIIGLIINFVLGILGVIFLIISIYGGITYMTAGGNEEKTHKAVHYVSRGAIGMAIILGSFLLTNYVVLKLLESIYSST